MPDHLISKIFKLKIHFQFLIIDDLFIYEYNLNVNYF